MKSKRCNQIGGGASLYSSNFYTQTAIGGNAAITRAGLETIGQAPMFNPLSDNTVFPTVSTGIVPSGLYYANVANTSTPFTQLGGGQDMTRASLNKMTVGDLRTLCNRLGSSCKQDSKFVPKQVLIARILSSTKQEIN